MNNVKYESINTLEEKIIFSITINGVKYTAATDYDLNIKYIKAPISMDEWIKQGCTSNVRLQEASTFIKAVSQQKIRNWWYRNRNFFDKFYSYSEA